ncbi:choice-of-anchor D domain-containing protein [Flavobacterium rhizosphaerae]|uniref:Choice-of-anchor D domain-containing protein n=1 Tax=Flavobacterium rhizosphaerae TaxID=3163298 RepID=A0ABW8Z280_9FLAO
MRKLLQQKVPLLLLMLIVLSTEGWGQYNLTNSSYSQNFNALSSTATTNLGTNGSIATLPGWYVIETGNGANSFVTLGTGSSNSGDSYNFGSTSSSDRSLGGLQSGSVAPYVGFWFINSTGATISNLAITYTGEQWRLGATGRNDGLTFEYSTSATTVVNGTWTGVPTLNFTAPNSSGSVGALDGNASANRAVVTGAISGINLAPNAKLFIRWVDINASGSDDGISIDDFSLAVCSAPVISSQPANQTVMAGNNATFSVTASGAGLTYQWQQKATGTGTTFQNISGATSAAYTVNAAGTSLSGYQYRVIVNNSCGSATSTSAVLTVNPTSPTITVLPASGTGYTYIQGYGPSPSQTYTVNAVNLTPAGGNLTVTGSTAFEVSANNVDFTSSVDIPYIDGTLSNTSVYVRLKAGLAFGNYTSQTIANSGGGAPTVNYTASGSVAQAFPEISISGNGNEIVSGDTTPQVADNTYFGTSLVINEDHTKTFVITNTGYADLIISDIQVSDPFIITSPTSFPISVAPLGGTQEVLVTFKTDTPGNYTGTVTVTNDDSNEGSYTFTVAAKADLAGPKMEVRGVFTSSTSSVIINGDTTPYSLDNTQFAQQYIGDTQTKTFRVLNTGNEALTVSSISVDNTADFEISNIFLPAVVAVGEYVDYDITFHPEQMGNRVAIVSIANNDTPHNNNPYTYTIQGTGNTSDIAVTGNGIAIATGSTTTSSVNNTYLGAANTTSGSNVSKVFTISNTGNVELIIGDISFSGANADNFNATVANTFVAPGDTTILTITATPATTGLKNAVISIVNNDLSGGENPYTFAVQVFGSGYVECSGNGIPETIITQDFEGDSPLSNADKWQGNFDESSYVFITGDTDYFGSDLFIDTQSYQLQNANEAAPAGPKYLNFDPVNTSTYEEVTFAFRLGSFSMSSGNGAESNDFVTVEVSTDGINWEPQVTVEGSNNSRWSFTSGTGVASAAYGSPETFQAGSYANTTTGYSNVIVTELPSVQNLYVRIKAINDQNNEVWAIDNVSLKGTPLSEKIYTDAGWSGDGNAPTSSEKVVIASDYTLTSGTLEGCELIVNEGITLTVGSADGDIATLNIQSEVTNNGAIIIYDDSALVQYNDAAVNEGAITYYKKANDLYRLDYTFWSSPVVGQKLQDFSPLTLTNRFYIYGVQEGEEAYVPVNPSTNFQPGICYLIRMPNQLYPTAPGVSLLENFLEYNGGEYHFSFIGKFEGVPSNGTIFVPASTEAYRYTGIGNPYASPISVQAFFEANQGVLNNGSTTDGNNNAPAIHFWRKKNNGNVSSYATLTLAGFVANAGIAEEGSGETTDPDYEYGGQEQAVYYSGTPDTYLIAPGQGFIVQAAESPSTPNIVFDNTMRREAPVDGTSFFRTGNFNTISRYWLNLKGVSQGFSQMAVAYKDGATMGIDYGYDGNIFSSGPISFYSLAANHELAIQARPLFEESDVVQAGYRVNSGGSYTIILDHADGVFNEGQVIYLKDKQLGISANITSQGYTFTTEAGTFNDRFEIMYLDSNSLGTDIPAFNTNNVIVFKSGNNLNITSNTQITGVYIYDINGRQIYKNTSVNDAEFAVSNFSVQSQIIIVKINTVKGDAVKKVIW